MVRRCGGRLDYGPGDWGAVLQFTHELVGDLRSRGLRQPVNLQLVVDRDQQSVLLAIVPESAPRVAWMGSTPVETDLAEAAAAEIASLLDLVVTDSLDVEEELVARIAARFQESCGGEEDGGGRVG